MDVFVILLVILALFFFGWVFIKALDFGWNRLVAGIKFIRNDQWGAGLIDTLIGVVVLWFCGKIIIGFLTIIVLANL